MRSVRRECLNHLIIPGLGRLQHVLDRYKDFFNQHRPHQGIGNKIPSEYNNADHRQGSSELPNLTARNVVRKDFLGGLLKSYRRAA